MSEPDHKAPYDPASAMDGMTQDLAKANESLQQNSSQAVELIVKAGEKVISSAPPKPNAADAAIAVDPELSDNVRSGLLARLRGFASAGPAARAPIPDDEDQFDQWAFSKNVSNVASTEEADNSPPLAPPAPAAAPVPPAAAKETHRPQPPEKKDDPSSWSSWLSNESVASPQERKWGDLLE